MAQDDDHKFSGWVKRLYSKVGESNQELFSVAAENGQKPTYENYTMMQAFEWYVPADHKHWERLRTAVPSLKAIGIDNLWIPPACKASSPEGNGYDIYDLYDLGEFKAKDGPAHTKWGTREELLELCSEAEKHHVGIYFDAVLNHKAAADTTEKCRAIKVDWDDRNKDISGVIEIDAYLGYDFKARGEKYSKQKYHWYHFTGTDWNASGGKKIEGKDNEFEGEKAIFRILGDGKNFAKDVDTEKGNYDYLMYADLDYNHPEVREDVKNWGLWAAKDLKLQGFRFDAIKHFSETFLQSFVEALDSEVGEGWFLVGEFWKTSLPDLQSYLQKMHHKFSLFDAPLVEKMHEISNGNKADLRKVFDGTLVQAEPWNAVTLVMNHDTQPSQALQLDIADWFKPLAYSLILLRNAGYPCVFYGDLYGLEDGVSWTEDKKLGPKTWLPYITLARKYYAYGEQNDYWDNPNLIGWVRRGTWDRPDGCAVVISNADSGEIRMYVGELHHGEVWTDVLGWSDRKVEIGGDGFGVFPCGSCSITIFVNEAAKGRHEFGKFNANIYNR